MKYLFDQGLLDVYGKLDYGCGKGLDADHYLMCKYDPYYFSDELAIKTRKYDVVTCNYVLNTISIEEANSVIEKIKALLNNNGIAYISVRRDLKKEGYTKTGTYQRNVVLDLPVLYEKSGFFCIYELKNEL